MKIKWLSHIRLGILYHNEYNFPEYKREIIMKKKYSIYASWYFFMFFAIGAFMPLFSQFLKFRNFNGIELGLALSLGSLATIVMQPIWGYISDHFKKPKKVLFFLISAVTLSAAAIAFGWNIYSITAFYIAFMFFYSGIGPISDSLVLGSEFEFGNIRLWGSIGFAIGVQVAGLLAQYLGIRIIFLVLAISYLVTLFIIGKVEVNTIEEHPISKRDIVKLLKNKDFLMFLAASFMISGTITAHNNYFGILYVELGGTIAGIGLAFLLFAGSEAPIMMLLAHPLIKRLNLTLALFLSSIIYNIRWFWYGTGPNPKWILILFVLQGLSIGSYLVFSVLFIKEITKANLRTTAIAIFTSFSTGIGGMFMQYMSGFIMDTKGIKNVYTFYFYATCISSIIYLALYLKRRKKHI